MLLVRDRGKAVWQKKCRVWLIGWVSGRKIECVLSRVVFVRLRPLRSSLIEDLCFKSLGLGSALDGRELENPVMTDDRSLSSSCVK